MLAQSTIEELALGIATVTPTIAPVVVRRFKQISTILHISHSVLQTILSYFAEYRHAYDLLLC